jgi:hypothetical protein
MLTNVSASGARLSDAGRLAPGTLVTVCQLQHRFAARVV